MAMGIFDSIKGAVQKRINPTEQQKAEIWKENLHKDSVARHERWKKNADTQVEIAQLRQRNLVEKERLRLAKTQASRAKYQPQRQGSFIGNFKSGDFIGSRNTAGDNPIGRGPSANSSDPIGRKPIVGDAIGGAYAAKKKYNSPIW
jgi:hypothetical protein